MTLHRPPRTKFRKSPIRKARLRKLMRPQAHHWPRMRRKHLPNETRHILSLSGGKDSAALAVYMRDRVPEMEYIFHDSQMELPETYAFLDRLEAFLGKPIVKTTAQLGFDHWYLIYGKMLPSNNRRWCTRQLKLKPSEEYVGTDRAMNYIGMRPDEHPE